MADRNGEPERDKTQSDTRSDILGGPDRSEYEDELGPEPVEDHDVLGGPDRALEEDELGPEPVEDHDVLGGPDRRQHEDELRPPERD